MRQRRSQLFAVIVSCTRRLAQVEGGEGRWSAIHHKDRSCRLECADDGCNELGHHFNNNLVEEKVGNIRQIPIFRFGRFQSDGFAPLFLRRGSGFDAE